MRGPRHSFLCRGFALGIAVAGAAPAAAAMRTDLNYLGRHGAYFRGDSLRYEKMLLDEWFRARILERRPAPR